MEIKLISGRFSVNEAEQLLTAIFKAKMSFHEEKIQSFHGSEEDIKHSEKRILQLEQTLRETIASLKADGVAYTNMEAHIDVSFPKRFGP
jgi:hypothetical protein